MTVISHVIIMSVTCTQYILVPLRQPNKSKKETSRRQQFYIVLCWGVLWLMWQSSLIDLVLKYWIRLVIAWIYGASSFPFMIKWMHIAWSHMAWTPGCILWERFIVWELYHLLDGWQCLAQLDRPWTGWGETLSEFFYQSTIVFPKTFCLLCLAEKVIVSNNRVFLTKTGGRGWANKMWRRSTPVNGTHYSVHQAQMPTEASTQPAPRYIFWTQTECAHVLRLAVDLVLGRMWLLLWVLDGHMGGVVGPARSPYHPGCILHRHFQQDYVERMNGLSLIECLPMICSFVKSYSFGQHCLLGA